MKTLEEILGDYQNYKTSNVLQDRLGYRLCEFLTIEQAKRIGFEITDPNHTPKEWTRENILAQLEEDVNFGFKKALGQRGISSALMFQVVRAWNNILKEGLEDWSEDKYAYYGLPLFKATAKKYNFYNPIGKDSGSEEKYNE